MVGKRTFSSSPKAATSMREGQGALAGSASAATMPATTPRGPSKRPASTTLSRCEPMINAGAPRSRPSRRPMALPTASMRPRARPPASSQASPRRSRGGPATDRARVSRLGSSVCRASASSERHGAGAGGALRPKGLHGQVRIRASRYRTRLQAEKAVQRFTFPCARSTCTVCRETPFRRVRRTSCIDRSASPS